MAGFRRRAKVPRAVHSQHVCVANRLAEHLITVCLNLESLEKNANVSGAFMRLVGDPSRAKYPALDASLVDLPAFASNFDPVAYVDKEYVEAMFDPTVLFPDGVAGVPRRVVRREDVAEYSPLVLREFRTGKLILSLRPACSAEAFVVGKRGGDRQR